MVPIVIATYSLNLCAELYTVLDTEKQIKTHSLSLGVNDPKITYSQKCFCQVRALAGSGGELFSASSKLDQWITETSLCQTDGLAHFMSIKITCGYCSYLESRRSTWFKKSVMVFSEMLFWKTCNRKKVRNLKTTVVNFVLCEEYKK